MRWVRGYGLPFVLKTTLPCTSACRAGSSSDARVVWHRLLEGEEAASLRVEAEALPAHHSWSIDEIASTWASVSGDDSVTMSSPPLELPSLDAIDRIVVTFGTEPAPRVLLLWSAEPVLSRADFLRNRRDLKPNAEGVAFIHGKDLRAYVGRAGHLCVDAAKNSTSGTPEEKVSPRLVGTATSGFLLSTK